MKTPDRTTATAGERHLYGVRPLCATSLIGQAVRPLLRAVSIAAVCVGGVAHAEPEGFAGRWVSVRDKLTLDISRCADGWCGVAVEEGRCGRTVLQLRTRRPGSSALGGTLQLAPDSAHYGVQAWVRSEADKVVLGITGHTGERFNPMRRMFDFRAELVRMDAPACTPDNKVS
jgi:hypothetical protein